MTNGSTKKMGIPKESFAGERRVSLAPVNVAAMQKLGFSVTVESGAGLASGFTDDAYQKPERLLSQARKIFGILARLSLRCGHPVPVKWT